MQAIRTHLVVIHGMILVECVSGIPPKHCYELNKSTVTTSRRLGGLDLKFQVHEFRALRKNRQF